MKKCPSPNFDDRKCAIDMLVLHYTGRPSLEESLDWLTDPEKKVSSHYLISEDGEVFQLVDEKKRAWHAGVSFWDGEADINSCSIGIELQNPGHEFGYKDFPEAQIDALIDLSTDIIKRHKIPAWRILGHSDVAPTRKQDPGEKFPWRKLAGEGIGLWPETSVPLKRDLDKALVAAALEDFGYQVSGPETFSKVVSAFQMHWHPGAVNGRADGETYRRLNALLRLKG